ncbi:MAG: nucleoside triphosphate pyrophosphohydrolase [Tidjanibacter sp.]|nr:nucleoside triphosphate pyrophosphohydrolase [Tidjanibacter sp.]MBR4038349.1 nucleoside triphosphate pyrophosphohydrolase [Tidjanibacter sp.]MBR6814164.1 nucleoside triphosphate pyrophosphohydrolase [Tidjanibacter sp.]MBR7103023.1 nucleoside triphosphate pyrophosphohydrolase [Tidjanibacter sp.]
MYEKQLSALERVLEIMDRLRKECPWDREQTFSSLRNNTIEETFELTEAITTGDMEGIKEELGDLLLHIVFYSKMGSEEGKFDIGDVCNALCDKLIYRHPHVFGDVEADGAEQVIHNWELLKIKEKAKKARKAEQGVLSGVPRSLPAMVKAFRVGEKAASAGFDWEQKEDVWAKVKEEVAEVEEAILSGNSKDMEGEIGDLFFALINMSRLYGVDPENALERTNLKFIERFHHIERQSALIGRRMADMSLAEMDALWDEAKKKELNK